MALWAQVPTVTLTLDKDTVQIGDVVHVAARVLFNEQSKVLNSALEDMPKSEHWEMVGRVYLSKDDSLDAKGRTLKIIHESFDALVFLEEGWLEFDPAVYQVQDRDSTYTVQSESVRVYVKPVIAVSDIPADLKTIIKEPLTFQDFLPWIIGLSILGLAIAFFFYLRNREPDRVLAKPTQPSVPPREKAIKDLKLLLTESTWKQHPKKTQVELSQIVRQYIEWEFKIPALENTTREIDRSLKKYLSSNQRNVLLKLLNNADMVKFAKLTMPSRRHQESLEEAIQWVSQNSFE